MKPEQSTNLKEFIIGAVLVIVTFFVILALGYFEGNSLYIGVTLFVCAVAIVVAYFIGYHHGGKKKKTDAKTLVREV
ncbi:MAG: hypothetical protein JW716_02495 [Candidatus Aenigmarchaeota archaeon]|nr:hypothetical protein [Candidatus Aenigmarchaeota archaeon]